MSNMAETEDFDVVDEEANTEIKAQVSNYCPFGCSLEDLNDRGYCNHLIGFTNDRKVMEPLTPIMSKDAEGNPEPTGHYRVKGRKGQTRPVPPGSKLVNPTEYQVADGIRRLANKWVSWRVYHKNPPVVEQKKVG